MANYDIQVALQNVNDLPRDRYINTFHWQLPGIASEATSIVVADAIKAAYQTHLSSYLSSRINSMTIKVYPSGPNPGGPIMSKKYAFQPPAGEAGPAEVAVCLSFYAGQNSPAKRGRVYIGPFSASTVSSERPLAIQNAVKSFGGAINAIGAGDIGEWVQASRKTGAYSPVTNWYVDNSWDTQRRRGAAPTMRVSDSG